MWGFILRLVWRLLIFLLGIFTVYATIFMAFPYLNDKLPIAIALLVIYCLIAYFAIPTLVRLWRLVIKPNHIPMYATTGDGWPSDPVNIAIVANSEKHFKAAMEKAGWYIADRNSLKNSILEAISIVFRTPYPNAPFSKLYLFGRAQDIGFQIPSNDRLSAYSRHHVRFWRLELPENISHHGHYYHWVKKLRHLLGADKEVWIGAAIEDKHSLGIRWRSGQLTHRNNKDIDSERDLIVSLLKESSQLKTISTIKAGDPFKIRGQQFDNKFISDGTLQVVELRSPVVTKLARPVRKKT